MPATATPMISPIEVFDFFLVDTAIHAKAQLRTAFRMQGNLTHLFQSSNHINNSVKVAEFCVQAHGHRYITLDGLH